MTKQRTHTAARGLAILAALAIALPAAAQQKVAVTGVVVDSASGAPVAGAHLNLGRRGIVVTDRSGRFDLGRLPTGEQSFVASGLGYDEEIVTVDVAPEMQPLRLTLAANPVELAEIKVQVDRLQSRRRAAATSVQVLTSADMVSGIGLNTRDVVLQRAMLSVVSCQRGVGLSLSQPYAGSTCVSSRGGTAQPMVYIDEHPSIAGLDELEAYNPDEIYMVEVYGGGRQVRVYTNWFMELSGRRHMNPMPIGV